MNIYYDNRQDEIEITEEMTSLIEKSVDMVLEVLELSKDVEVSISFVSDDEIRELNRDYRNVDRTTDVLSFPIDDEFEIDSRILGDVVINTKKVIEQAKEYEHSNTRELSYLTVHSILHLLGYDHIEESDKEEMRRVEKLVMKELGIERWLCEKI